MKPEIHLCQQSPLFVAKPYNRTVVACFLTLPMFMMLLELFVKELY